MLRTELEPCGQSRSEYERPKTKALNSLLNMPKLPVTYKGIRRHGGKKDRVGIQRREKTDLCIRGAKYRHWGDRRKRAEKKGCEVAKFPARKQGSVTGVNGGQDLDRRRNVGEKNQAQRQFMSTTFSRRNTKDMPRKEGGRGGRSLAAKRQGRASGHPSSGGEAEGEKGSRECQVKPQKKDKGEL